MRFEDLVFVVLLIAMMCIVYLDIAYMTHEDGSTPIADIVYKDGSAKGEKFGPASDRK